MPDEDVAAAWFGHESDLRWVPQNKLSFKSVYVVTLSTEGGT